MFQVSGPDYGWTLKRMIPPLPGLGKPLPALRIPLWLAVVIVGSITLDRWVARRVMRFPSPRYVVATLLWALVAIPVVRMMLYRAAIDDFVEKHQLLVAITWAITAVVPPYLLVKAVERLIDRWRVPKGFCKTCRYNLVGNVSGVCPECGTPVASPDGGEPKR